MAEYVVNSLVIQLNIIHWSQKNKTQEMFVKIFYHIKQNSFLGYVYIFIDPWP